MIVIIIINFGGLSNEEVTLVLLVLNVGPFLMKAPSTGIYKLSSFKNDNFSSTFVVNLLVLIYKTK